MDVRRLRRIASRNATDSVDSVKLFFAFRGRALDKVRLIILLTILPQFSVESR
jgi:hypothetical protein